MHRQILLVGLSDGTVPDDLLVGEYPNSYAYGSGNDYCWLSDKVHDIEWPAGAIKPTWKYGIGDVVGCGILVNRENKVAIFFTGNGKLIGKFT
jgi:hypothetical protein